MSPIIAEVSDKMTPLGSVLLVELGICVAALLLGRFSRWLLVPFIVVAALFLVGAVTEPWTDPYFWSAVRAEKGRFYHAGYVLTIAVPFALLCAAFIFESKRKRRANQRPESNAGKASLSPTTPGPGVAHP